MRIATWNVNGIRARADQVADWLRTERPDVLCLQELKATLEQIPDRLRACPGYWGHWHGSKGYSGVALLVREDLVPTATAADHPPFDFETRIATVELAGLRIASVYVPNGGKDFEAKRRFVQALVDDAATRQRADTATIYCGDMNITRADIDVHPKERKPRAIGQLPEERALFQALLDQGLVDVGRLVAPDDDRLFTWWAPWRNLRQRNIGWRLDYLLATGALAGRVQSCRVDASFGSSDHAPVVAEFEW